MDGAGVKKNVTNREQIQRLLNGDLSPAEEQELRRALAESAELREELEQHRRLQGLLAESAGQYDAFFAARVVNRIHARLHDDEWIAGLLGAFRKVAVVAIILTGLLLAHNVASQWEARRDLNIVEMTLAIPPVTIQSSLDQLNFGL